MVETQVHANEYKEDDAGDLSVFPEESLGADNSLDYDDITRVHSENWKSQEIL